MGNKLPIELFVGLKIVKNDKLPSMTIIASPDVFALYHDAVTAIANIPVTEPCQDCGATGDDVTLDADPYAQELHGDDTPV